MRTARASDHPPIPAGWDRSRHSLLGIGRPAVIADPVPFYHAVAELPPVYWDETSISGTFPTTSVVIAMNAAAPT